MTESRLKAILKLWQSRLALDHWEIELVTDSSRWDGAMTEDAYVWQSTDYDVGRIYVNPATWRDWSEAESHENILHELVHLRLREFETVLDQIEPLIHPETYSVVKHSFRHALEGAVQRLTVQMIALAGDVDVGELTAGKRAAPAKRIDTVPPE